MPKLAAVLALGAEATTNPETLEPSEVARVIDATDAALRALYEELARQESRVSSRNRFLIRTSIRSIA